MIIIDDNKPFNIEEDIDVSGIKMEMGDDNDPHGGDIENDYDECVLIHIHIYRYFRMS